MERQDWESLRLGPVVMGDEVQYGLGLVFVWGDHTQEILIPELVA